MKLFKSTVDSGAATPTKSESKLQSTILLLFLSLMPLFQSCDPTAIIDADKRQKWDNAYLWFNPGNLETIYVSEDANIKHAAAIPNDSEYLIEWEKSSETYSLKVTSYGQEIDFAWFTGYDAANSSEEIPWVKSGNTIELISTKLKPAENGRYQVSISDDLQD